MITIRRWGFQSQKLGENRFVFLMLIDSGVNVATEMWKNHEKPMVSDNHLDMVVVFHVDFLAFTGENDSSQVVLEGMEHLSHRVSTPFRDECG